MPTVCLGSSSPAAACPARCATPTATDRDKLEMLTLGLQFVPARKCMCICMFVCVCIWCHFIAGPYCLHPQIFTSNVTSRRGPRAGYRAPSLKRTSCPNRFRYNARHMLRCVFIAKCGIACFLCGTRAFEVQASSSPPRLPLRQI